MDSWIELAESIVCYISCELSSYFFKQNIRAWEREGEGGEDIVQNKMGRYTIWTKQRLVVRGW